MGRIATYLSFIRFSHSVFALPFALTGALLAWLLGKKCACDQGGCGDVRVRHRLIVKTVDGCATTQCVPRAAPADPNGA